MDEYQKCIEKIAESVAKSNGINNYETGPIEVNPKVDGYLSKIFSLTIQDKTSKKKLDILLKYAFKNEEVRKSLILIPIYFANEIYFYSVIYPELEKFRKSVNCPKDYELLAKCYETSVKPKNEYLVLDNLKAQGFGTLDRKLDYTNEHVELIFKNYAYFHGLSLAFKEKNPDKFAEIISKIRITKQAFLKSKIFVESTKRIVQEINNVLTSGKDDKLVENFKKYQENSVELVAETLDGSGKYVVIRHGDCRSNNQLFKYNENTGKPVDLRIVDWQVMTVGSPVCDLSYALYSDASKSHLDRLGDYLKIYYDTLSSTLRNLGCNPETVFSFQELRQQWKTNAKFGFLIGGVMLREKCAYAEDVKAFEDFDNKSDNVNLFYNENYDVERCNKKLYDLICHMNEIGAL